MSDTKNERPSDGYKANPVEACTIRLAAHFGRTVSLGQLRSVFTPTRHDDEIHRVEAAIAATEKAGFRANVGECNLENFSQSWLPAIFLTTNKSAVIVYSADDEWAKVYDPAHPKLTRAVPIHELRKRLTGSFLSLQLELRHEPSERSAGQKAHWFRDALRSQRWSHIQVILASVMINLLALVASLFSMVVYDRILPSESSSSLYALSFGVVIALLLDLALKTLRSHFIDSASQKVDIHVAQDLFGHVLDTEMASRKGSVGNVAASMRELESLREFFTSATVVALVDTPFVLIFLLVIALLAGSLALIPGVAVVLVIGLGLMIQPALQGLSDQLSAQGQAKQSILTEALTGIETIKSVGARNYMQARWFEAQCRQANYSVKSRAITQAAINATGFIQQMAQILVISYGAILVMGGSATSGVLIAAVMLTGRALAPMTLISQTMTRFNNAKTSYKTLDGLMKSPSDSTKDTGSVTRNEFSGSIKFEDVTFAYPGQKTPTLEKVSFTIAAGERVAILGPVGSGKSTIVRLLLGLYRPGSGAILLDGVDVRQIEQYDIHSNVGAVMQEPWLVSGTIRDNIVLGDARVADEDVIRAANIADVEQFVGKLPEGYAFQVGERGQRLSGGQRQCIALARALIHRPPIMVLDEPTSSMDSATETRLINGLKACPDLRTLIVVTHRQNLLSLVDRVIVLENGKVALDKRVERQSSGASQRVAAQ